MCYFLRYKKSIRIDLLTFTIVYLYVFFVGISSVFNSDVRLLQGAIIFFILYHVSFGLPSLFHQNKINNILFKIIIVVYILTVIFPLIINGLDSVPYQGIFYNTNSLGVVSASTFAVVISVFIFNIERFISSQKKFKYFMITFLIYLFSLSVLFYFVVLSGSRTAFLSCALVSLVGFLYLIFYLIKEKKIIQFLLRGFIAIIPSSLVIYLLIKFTDLTDILNYVIVDKFNRKAGSGDVLASRGEIWTQTLKDARIFGNGGDYFNNILQIGSHNTFINILGRYGWVPLIIFILLILIMTLYSIKYAMSNTTDKYKYMPLSLSISFLTLSMAENVMNSLIMLAMFFSIGSIVFSSKESKKIDNIFRLSN